MKRKVALVAFLSLFASSAVNAGQMKDAVVDSDGEVLYNSFDNCVITKWNSSSANCGNSVQNRGSRSYMVFFDFNSDEITDKSKSILKRAVNASLGKAGVEFKVVGHADKSGSASYNKSLSKRRADAVTNALVEMGVVESRVATSSKGESKPLVSTADGVREAQNRRVEVTFSY